MGFGCKIKYFGFENLGTKLASKIFENVHKINRAKTTKKVMNQSFS